MHGIFTQTFIVPNDVIDVNGHVSNLEYFRWMQEIATEHSSAQGWPLERYVRTGTSWVIRSHAIEYLRPVFAGETISLLTWIASFEEKKSKRGYLFWRASDQKILAKAETLWVFVDAATGRPSVIPEEFKAQFEVVAQEDVLQAARLIQAKGTAPSQDRETCTPRQCPDEATREKERYV